VTDKRNILINYQLCFQNKYVTKATQRINIKIKDARIEMIHRVTHCINLRLEYYKGIIKRGGRKFGGLTQNLKNCQNLQIH